MKLRFLVGAAVGYVLGARAGRARYDSIVRLARAVASSQAARNSAGVAQAHADDFGKRLRHAVGHVLTHDDPSARPR